MNILVCVKKILADEADIFISDRKIEKECLVHKFNTHDVKAFLEGMAIREWNPGSILDVVSADGRDADPFLRLLMASGADSGHRLWDDSLPEGAELDNASLGEILSGFIRRNGYDLVLFGGRSEYFGAGTLPVIVGCMLGIPAITNVTRIEPCDGGMLVHQMLEKGRRAVFRCMPRLVMSMECGDPVPLEADLERRIASHEAPINVLPFRGPGRKEDFLEGAASSIEYSYPKPRTKFVLIPESASVEDRLGFLMGGGVGKKDSGTIEGGAGKVAEAICNGLARRNVFREIRIRSGERPSGA